MQPCLRVLLMLVGLFSVVGCGDLTLPGASSLDEAWNSANDPRRLVGQYQTNFFQLPQRGETGVRPWTDYYWASQKGGTAFRWVSNQTPAEYIPYGINQINDLSPSQMARLSPAEKYDIFRGDFSYTTQRYEMRRTASQRESWAGLCHGWAAASINFSEPRPVELVGATGVRIPFGAADVKALLALAQQYERPPTDNIVVGMRCNMTGNSYYNPSFHLPECRDINAGSFHIILANYIGMRGQSFMFDYAEDHEVWNFPVTGYTTQVLGDYGWYPGVAYGTARIISVQTVVNFIGITQPSWEPTGSTGGRSQTYRYTVELDDNGNVIGGEWLDQKRPDFLWVQSATRFKDFLSGVGRIHAASLFGRF